MKAEKIDSLTSLRFFAAAAVVVLHARHTFGDLGLSNHLALTQAVSLFFVLSGFILAHTHRSIPTGREILKFYTSRFARIWPLHVVCAAIAFYLIRFDGAEVPPLHAFLNVTLLQSWSTDIHTYFSLNGISWSLSDELFFYACFPLLIHRIEQTWRLKLIATIALTAAVIAASSGASREMSLWSTYILPATRLSEFMLGIGAYQLYRNLGIRTMLSHRSTGIEIIVVLVTITMIWLARLPYFADAGPAWRLWISNDGAAIAFAALILVMSLERGAISRVIQKRPLIYLGEVSFSLYLVHQLVLRFMQQHGYGAGLGHFWGGVFYWCAAMSCAIVAHHLIENPARNLIINLSSRVLRPSLS
ncbi:acyltransferase [Paraburkholderia dipogonis]|uniref:Acyltransferase n=1 Tax=Paraburkholderia dipogonis TaxID=1211383 RepID=A0ABW9ATQ7_9BURK